MRVQVTPVPTTHPALDAEVSRFAESWSGSIVRVSNR